MRIVSEEVCAKIYLKERGKCTFLTETGLAIDWFDRRTILETNLVSGWTVESANSTIHKLLFGWPIGLLVEPTISFCSQELFGRRSDPPVGLATPRMHSNHCFWRNWVREQCYELPITLWTLRSGRRSNEKGRTGLLTIKCTKYTVRGYRNPSSLEHFSLGCIHRLNQDRRSISWISDL